MLPKRWQTNPAVLTAMVGAGLLLQCSSVLAQKDEPVALMGDVAAPMVVMSESDARRIIADEAKKAGIVFGADKKKMRIPLGSLDTLLPSEKPKPGATTTVTLDGTSSKLGVSYEYISEADEKALTARRGGALPAGNAAAVIKAEGEKTMKGRVLAIPTVRAYSQETAETQLRAQVREFIKWLKGQGVI